MTRGSAYPQPPTGAGLDVTQQPHSAAVEAGISVTFGAPARQAVHALTGDPTSVRTARRHTREFLERAVQPTTQQFLTDALLAVSELVANAVTHAPGPCVLVLRDDGEQLAITVRDNSFIPITPRAPDHDGDEGGFGWHVLRRLATRMTTEYGAQGKSTTVIMPKSGPRSSDS